MPTPAVEVLVNLFSSLSMLLNHPLGTLATDGETKQSLLESISSLSKAALPSSVQPLYRSLCRFMEDLLEQVPKVDVAKASFSQASQQLGVFNKELEGSIKAKDLASTKLAVGEAHVQDMSSEIAIVEQKLKALKEKKDVLNQAVGKLRVDIIKAENKLSKK